MLEVGERLRQVLDWCRAAVGGDVWMGDGADSQRFSLCYHCISKGDNSVVIVLQFTSSYSVFRNVVCQI